MILECTSFLAVVFVVVHSQVVVGFFTDVGVSVDYSAIFSAIFRFFYFVCANHYEV